MKDKLITFAFAITSVLGLVGDRVAVVSAPGEGATIRVLIPCRTGA